ncbi:MAG: glycosyltransferase family 39 protein [Butyrivibrio sp.]|nr:glycosyltransferase family 39 protein [Butyrivibrio sp.]
MNKEEKRYYVAVAVMLFAALFLRLFRLGEVPRGLHVDEIGMAYDSWCIGHFGVDRYLNSFPVYLSNYGGGQSVLYCYLDVPFILLGGINAVAVRLPSVIFSMLTAIFGCRLVKIISGKRASLLYLFIFLTVPYFTQASRIGLDCNLMLGLSVMMLNLIEYCLREENYGKIKIFILLGLLTGITMYSYALSNIILPLFYIFLFIYMIITKKKIALKSVIAFAIPAAVLALPLALVQVVNIYGLPSMHFGPITIPVILQYRLDDIVFDQVKPNLHWTFDSLFRADNTDFDSFPQFGALYMFSIPVLIVGAVINAVRIIKDIPQKKFRFEGAILIYAFTVLLLGLFIQGVTTYRINSAFFGLSFLIVTSIDALISWGKKTRVWTAAGILLSAAYLVSSIFFIKYYFTEYEDDIYPQRLFAEDPTNAYDFLESQPSEITGRLTYVGGANEAFIYYLWSREISPYEYDHNSLGNNGDGVKYSFWAPEPYDSACNYIFYLPEEEERKALLDLGFEETDFGAYKVYIHS